FPDAGAQPRGQHTVLEVSGPRDDAWRRGHEGAHRADEGAGAEHRVIQSPCFLSPPGYTKFPVLRLVGFCPNTRSVRTSLHSEGAWRFKRRVVSPWPLAAHSWQRPRA